jgi:hypothetical protein
MSSQGTGSIKSLGFEYQLLESWGDWARGDINLWFSGSVIWKKNGIGSLFSESDLCQADALIATMPTLHKKTLKHWFINRKGHQIDEHKRQAAISAFSELIQESGKEPSRPPPDV